MCQVEGTSNPKKNSYSLLVYFVRFWNTTKASVPDHFNHNIIFTNIMGGSTLETTLTVRHYWRTEGILRKAKVRQGGAWRSPYLVTWRTSRARTPAGLDSLGNAYNKCPVIQ